MLGLDAQFSIVSYAVVTSKYESNKNIANSFLPLIEHLMLVCEETDIRKKELLPLFNEVYGYDIPPAVLDGLLKTLKYQKKIDFLTNESILIQKDRLIDFDSDYERRMRALTSDFELFENKQGKTVNRADVIKHFLKFLIENSVEFSSFVSSKTNFEDIQSNDTQKEIIAFLVEERRANSDNYRFIRDVFYGVTLSTLLSSGSEQDIKPNLPGNLKYVLLDSNFLFRLLDLQTEFEHIVSIGTYNSLKDAGCQFFILPDTLKQIADTIRNAINKYSESATKVLRIAGEERFSGLNSACLRRNLTPACLNEIISSLEDTFTSKFGFNIVSKDESKCISYAPDDFSALACVKSDSSDEGIIHDLKLANYVKSKRDSNLYVMNQAEWWVLTDDLKLTKWNSNYPQKNRIPECITESQLSTVLWLENPQNLSFDSLLSTALTLRNRDLLSDKDYYKISQGIERQIERYKENPSQIKKLSMVFSSQLLSLEDMADEDSEMVDKKFDNALEESISVVQERNELRESNKRITQEKEDEKTEFSSTIDKLVAEIKNEKEEKSRQISLLSKEQTDHIETLKSMRQDKENALREENERKEKLDKKVSRISKLLFVILSSLVIITIIVVIKKILISNNGKLENFYSSNQFVFWLISVIASALLGFVLEKIQKISQHLVSFNGKVLLKLFFRQKYQEINERIEKLESKIDEIQAQIDCKIADKTTSNFATQ